MANPTAALRTQLKNIQAKTGKTVAELHALLATSGLAKHGEKRAKQFAMVGHRQGDRDRPQLQDPARAPAPESGEARRHVPGQYAH